MIRKHESMKETKLNKNILPFTISTILISSLSFFHLTGIAQDNPACFIVTPSGQVINLNALCGSAIQSQAVQKARACQGPFDRDGFPIALSRELEDFKVAMKRVVETQSGEIEIDAALESLLAQVYFPPKTQNLQRKARLLSQQLQKASTDEEIAKIGEEYNSTIDQLKVEPCYSQIREALDRKSLLP